MPTHYSGSDDQRAALDAFIKLMRAADSLSARTLAHLGPRGISPSQFGVLEALYHRGPLHQCELSRKLLKSGGNITMVVDHLEQRGLAVRQRDAADRRRVSVALTAAGRRLIAQLFPRHAAIVAREMAALTPAEQAQLGRLCKKLGLAAAAADVKAVPA